MKNVKNQTQVYTQQWVWGGYCDNTINHIDINCSDNISRLNKFFCELTGTNYVWKTSTEDIIGICHYRRYFNFMPLAIDNKSVSGWIKVQSDKKIMEILSNAEQERAIRSVLNEYDIIVPKANYSHISIGEDYKIAHGSKEWSIFLDVLDDFYGEKKHSLRIEKRNFFCNMLLAKKDVFDLYCSELFPVINKVFDIVGIPEGVDGVRYQPFRYPGYLAERFMTAFINANRLKFYEADLLELC
ncbi:DUF4422 domain-containing protein [Polynucleobacter paneuropaeus]|nr:DUF4422 domain-containing protein [Polynucleobacter paneuropaeus]